MTEEAVAERRKSTRARAWGSFSRLGEVLGKGRVPFMGAMEAADCGAACLGMVLGYYGRHESLGKMHETVRPGRDGLSARTIAEAANKLGLVTRALSVPQSAWGDLPPASIIHWRFNHFVVFESIDRAAATILDPALGRRRIELDEFRRSFTGVALTFTPGERFERRAKERSKAWDVTAAILKERRLIVRILAMSLVLQLLGLVFPAITSLIVDRVLPRGDASLLSLVAISVVVLTATQVVSELIRSLMLTNLQVVLDAKLTMQFFEHLLALPYSFFQKHTDGDLLMRLNSNATIRDMLTNGIFSAVLDGTLVLGYLGIIFFAKPLLGLVTFGATFLVILPGILSRRAALEIVARSLEAQAKSQSLEVEVLRAIETIKAMGLEPDTLERWSNLFVDTLNIDLERARISTVVVAAKSLINTLTPAAILWVGARLVLAGEMQAGEMIAISSLGSVYVGRISTLVDQWRNLQVLSRYLERIRDVVETEVEQPKPGAPLGDFKGELMADNVTYQYEGAVAAVVDGVTLSIIPGESVAFVGGSGSGKSTLVKLFAGLYLPTSGRILVDGISLTEMEIRDYRQRISVVTQETQLFAGSIRSNISLPLPDVPLSEVIAAAKLACVHDDILAMPMGYETPLTDQGRSLSGGQRQRLALARALVRKPRVLLLDEATSAIDPITEARIKANLDKLSCTRLIVAHRLSTIRDVDRIVVLGQGKVLEMGRHDELLARGGSYSELALAGGTGSLKS